MFSSKICNCCVTMVKLGLQTVPFLLYLCVQVKFVSGTSVKLAGPGLTLPVRISELNVANHDVPEACETLYLLNVMPTLAHGKGKPDGPWERGAELSQAGHSAAKRINARSDILNGYKLELMDVDSELCSATEVTHGLVNFYQKLIHSNITQCIVGVVGLYCSAVTRVIASLAGHPNISYVQFSASTSPILRNRTTYPKLFHTVSSASVFNRAVISLMREFDWMRISQVYDTKALYLLTTANDFARKIEDEQDLKLVLDIPITDTDKNGIIFNRFSSEEVRISYWSTISEQIAKALCEASQKERPEFVYIFHEVTLEDILNVPTSCPRHVMQEAVEGIYMMQYKLKFNDSLIGHPDLNVDNEWAGLLYDQVWAFALALNYSLSKMFGSLNKTYNIGSISTLTDAIVSELETLKFPGVSSDIIQFNEDHEVENYVEIYQVKNGEPRLIGTFDPKDNNITFSKTPENVPKDRFLSHLSIVPQPLAITIFVVQGALCVLITLNLILLLCWRKKPEVKAMSPYLSGLMFLGCYLLCIVPVMQTLFDFITPKALFSALCNMEYWLTSNGLNLIFATLFVRLLRIFYVFRKFKRTGKLWSDKFLFLYVILICSVQVVCVLVIWAIVDPLRKEMKETYVVSSSPHYVITKFCTSDNVGVWITISFAYTGLIVAMVIFLAVQTRHIKKENFKDTKKVNVFVAMVATIIIVGLTLKFVFSSVDIKLALHLVKWLTDLSIPLLCQLLLFVPKTLPLCSSCLLSPKSERPPVQERFTTQTSFMYSNISMYSRHSTYRSTRLSGCVYLSHV